MSKPVIGPTLRRLRTGQGLSQQALAQKLGPLFTGQSRNRAKINAPWLTALRVRAPQLFALASPAVAKVRVADAGGKVFAQGSGFLVSADAAFVTGQRVVVDGGADASPTG